MVLLYFKSNATLKNVKSTKGKSNNKNNHVYKIYVSIILFISFYNDIIFSCFTVAKDVKLDAVEHSGTKWYRTLEVSQPH